MKQTQSEKRQMNRLLILSTKTLIVMTLGLLLQQRNQAFAQGKVTMLIAYTKRACNEVGGGTKAIHAMVRESVKATNEAFVNSKIGCQIQILPKFVEVDYMLEHTNATMKVLHDEFEKPDGKFNGVHRIRKEQKADLMCLIYSGIAGGRAQLNGSIMINSLMGLEVKGGGYCFPHEVGHLFGATHEGGVAVAASGLGPYFSDHRTILGPGGAAIPYYSENRTVTTYAKSSMLGDAPKRFSPKIGDATHDNATTMRKNAPAKFQLGEQLKDVAVSASALKTRLVDPLVDPGCPNAKKPFQITNFSVNKSGKNVNVNFGYQATVKGAEDALHSGKRWRIVAFTKDGDKDTYNAPVTGFINSGTHNKPHTFAGHPRFAGKEMKPGSWVELQLVTRAKDGTYTVNDVVKRVYIEDSGVRIDDTIKPKEDFVLVDDGSDDSSGGTGAPGDTDTDTGGAGKSSSAGKSSGAGNEEFEVILLMGNSSYESYHVTLERNSKKIGEFHLAGTDELWDGAHTRAITHPAYFAQEFRNWKTINTSLTLRKYGKTKPGAYTRIRTGVRFGDTLRVKRVGSPGPEKTWVVKAVNATGSQTFRLKSGKDITVREMTFNTKTDLPRPPQQRRRRVVP